MDKPKKYLPNPTYRYDLTHVLHYIDEFVPNFSFKIWDELCDLGYIENDTSQYIDFKEIFGDTEDDTIKEGLKILFKEFPDIKSGEFLFDIIW